MLRFARLYDELDQTTRTSEKLAALQSYFREAPPDDAAWGLYFLTGRRHKRAVSATLLRDAAAEFSGYPTWLLNECYNAVGDFSETIALLLPEPVGEITPRPLHEAVEQWIQPLQQARDAAKRRMLPEIWSQLDSRQRFVFHKLISGTFRVGVARGLVVRALAAVASDRGAEIDPATMEHRVMGNWEPTAAGFRGLLAGRAAAEEGSGLYPFCLANQLNGPPDTLGDIADYLIEHKWDGIRAQLIRRPNGEVLIWSRGEELITPQFPEAAAAGALLDPGTVLDGEILIWEDPAPPSQQTVSSGSPRPFAELQTRINRKPAAPKPARRKDNGQLGLFAAAPGDESSETKAESAVPAHGARAVVFMAYDVLEHQAADVRSLPLERRRELLEQIVQHAAASRPDHNDWLPLRISPLVLVNSWDQATSIRDRSRELGVEGLMLKPRQSIYGVGRTRAMSESARSGGGGWWKWKIDPYSVDAVLMYAQPGTGKRASIYSDQTFGVWDESPAAAGGGVAEGGGRELVPFAKAYSGLTDEELREVDAFVRRNSIDKSGPVRMVKPELVFEIAFEGIQESTRHRSGIAVRFPRIKAWRRDKKAADADSLEAVRSLLRASQARAAAPARPGAEP